MTFRGRVHNGQILLQDPVRLPEGASVDIKLTVAEGAITQPTHRTRPQPVRPIELPGPSLADELVRERR